MNLRSRLPRGLEEAFAALRQQYTEEPPSHLEVLLLARLRTRRRMFRAKLWSVAAAVTAATILVPWSVARYHSADLPRRVVPLAYPGLPVPAVPATSLSPAVGPPRTADHPLRSPRKRPQRADLPDTDGFLPIPYSAPLAPSEQVDVYRVELPRAALAHYGWPIPAGGPNSLVMESPVTAELAVGSDGLVRAVRFVDNF